MERSRTKNQPKLSEKRCKIYNVLFINTCNHCLSNIIGLVFSEVHIVKLFLIIALVLIRKR